MMLRSPMMSKITMGGVEEELSVLVANMEEPCLLGLDFLVQSAVESPVAGSDVKEKGLEIHCWIMKEGEGTDSTVTAHGCKAAVTSGLCWVDGGASGARPTLLIHVADLVARSAAKLIPGQAEEMAAQEVLE
ncbi:hypothetical protein E2C01_037510 [Portunus trituberculatus]|uniref:Uncharacterized protein n=1 Tax=Portunus trituberculatus TaxID=210409 RepID=A0A5B7FET2_PORTR|nr:hypothetical protein [Portunus trituberculatus]